MRGVGERTPTNSSQFVRTPVSCRSSSKILRCHKKSHRFESERVDVGVQSDRPSQLRRLRRSAPTGRVATCWTNQQRYSSANTFPNRVRPGVESFVTFAFSKARYRC